MLTLPCAACGLNGDDPASWGTVRYIEPQGTFALEFLMPPWEVLSVDGGLRMRIAPELFGYDLDVAASTHGLEIATVTADDLVSDLQGVESFVPADEVFDPLNGLEIPGMEEPLEPLAEVALDDPFAVASAELTHLALEGGAKIDFDLTPMHNAAGQEGLTYQVISSSDTFMRMIYLPSQHGVVRIAMVSIFDVATADIDHMLDGIAIDVVPPATEDEPAMETGG